MRWTIAATWSGCSSESRPKPIRLGDQSVGEQRIGGAVTAQNEIEFDAPVSGAAGLHEEMVGEFGRTPR
jgi:hypothetical protein